MNISDKLKLKPVDVLSSAAFWKMLDNYSEYLNSKKEVKSSLENIDAFASWFDIPVLLGVEVEVEGVTTPISMPKFVMSKTDGSLRNNGIEYTTVPLPPRETFAALQTIWFALNKFSKTHDFSWRTSIQVHLDMRQLTEEEFKRFLILCLIFERFFFEFVGNVRRHSIFCVPLTETDLLHALRKFLKKKITLETLCKAWPKYSALNLFRMVDQAGTPALGTAEFRHLGGTENLSLIFVWISIILKLFSASVKLTDDELKEWLSKLNTSSEYFGFMVEVFGVELAHHFEISDFPSVFSCQISRAKELFSTNPKLEELTAESSMGKFLAKEEKKREEEEKLNPKPKVSTTFEIPPPPPHIHPSMHAVWTHQQMAAHQHQQDLNAALQNQLNDLAMPASGVAGFAAQQSPDQWNEFVEVDDQQENPFNN